MHVNIHSNEGVRWMPDVKCSVSNCVYWGQGNECKAPAIMVEVDDHSDADFDTEVGDIGIEESHTDQAVHSSETCCHTFKPKNK